MSKRVKKESEALELLDVQDIEESKEVVITEEKIEAPQKLIAHITNGYTSSVIKPGNRCLRVCHHGNAKVNPRAIITIKLVGLNLEFGDNLLMITADTTLSHGKFFTLLNGGIVDHIPNNSLTLLFRNDSNRPQHLAPDECLARIHCIASGLETEISVEVPREVPADDVYGTYDLSTRSRLIAAKKVKNREELSVEDRQLVEQDEALMRESFERK